MVIGAAGRTANYSESDLGALASAYLAAFTLAGIFGAALQQRLAVRPTAIAGFVLLVGGLTLNAAIPGVYGILMTGFILSGVGAGTLFAISFRLISLARRLERAFGFKLFAEQVLGALLFFTLPLVAESFTSLMVIAATVLAACAAILRWLPSSLRRSEEEPERDAPGSGGPAMAFLLGLLCLGLFMSALSGPWAFLETLVFDAGVQGAQFSTLGAAGILLGAIGALGAGLQGARFGMGPPMLLGGLLLALCLWGLTANSTPITVIVLLIVPLFWNYVLTFQMSATSALDQQHDYSSWLAPSVALGATLGPISFGVFVERLGAMSPVLLAASVVLLLSLAISAWLSRRI